MSNTQNPLAAGFLQGLRFDNPSRVSAMNPPTNSIPDLESFAKFYCTCERTIRRWHEAGVDVESPIAVARHVLDQQAPSPDVLERIHEIFN